ncbi:MAG: hypothetical protein JWM68_906 [Verrucomicrobiales bacterium]|nr:hypothetical protein [Verrucomicrobiales bacterium]
MLLSLSVPYRPKNSHEILYLGRRSLTRFSLGYHITGFQPEDMGNAQPGKEGRGEALLFSSDLSGNFFGNRYSLWVVLQKPTGPALCILIFMCRD